MKSIIIRDVEISVSTTVVILFVVLIVVVGSVWASQTKPQPQLTCGIGPALKITPDQRPPTAGRKVVAKDSDNPLKTSTREIFKANRELQKRHSSDLNVKIKEEAQQRKTLMLATMRQAPEIALSQVLKESERSKAEELTQGCVEEPTTVEGLLEIVHADFNDDTTVNTYFLNTANKERIAVHPAHTPKMALKSGEHLKITGYKIDNDLLFDAAAQNSVEVVKKHNLPWEGEVAQAATSDTFGTQQTLVLMVYFQNTSKPPLTKASVDNTVFTKMNSYYQETSYNQMDIVGTTVDWKQIALNQTCDISSVVYDVREAAIAAVDPVVNFANYSRIIMVANYGGAACVWAGLGTVGKTYISTADGNINASLSWVDQSSMSATTHEFGHNLGLNHASFYDCGSASLSASGCAFDEYGDLFSPMGSGNTAHLNAPEKDYLGWLGTTHVQTITSNGTYSIEPLETTPSALKTIKVQRSNGSSDAYDYTYYEYRTSTGSDTGLVSNVYTGALLHNFTDSYTLLLDATPPASQTTPALPSGSSFTDPETATKVTLASKSANALTFNVVLGRTDFSTPTLSFTSPKTGATIAGNVPVTVSASAPSGIQKVDYYVDYAATPTFTSTTAPFSFNLDTTTLSDGYHTISAQATDKAGEPYSAPGNVSDFVDIYPVVSNDPTAPTASITAPAPNTTVAGNAVTVSANASDNNSISRVEFYIDGNFKTADYSSPYAYVWDTTLATDGNHTLTVKAYDPATNATTSSPVNVTVYNNIANDTLSSGQTLNTAGLLKSSDGRYKAILQGDGNFVVYDPNNKALWSTVTGGYPGAKTVMQTDGNLVVYDSASKPLWNSVTPGYPGAKTVMQTDGNLVIYDASNKPLWSWMSGRVPSDTLNAGRTLDSGFMLRSSDGKYSAIMQTDGNLVVYDSASKALWSTVTGGYKGARAFMQNDGNFVVYSTSNRPLWNSETPNNPDTKLVIQTDGNLVLYNASNKALWSWKSGKL